ncbi:unnamed protein product [Anisakis simplex]|uniref:TGF_BETA_2 domain-containing protein n=1 Tax=Anisakis simplex TaxID=6269 RepID=A0A0M3JVJ1_ANISI|nr:unnamed protein product [Anisakis simplex]
MIFSRFRILLTFTALLNSVFAAFNSPIPTEQQKDVLQKAVKELLDFKRLPRPGEVMRPVSRTADAASKYMQKLFEKYQRNGNFRNLDGNIVRSISPTAGSFLGEEALSFKLNTIKQSERQIIRAELHYNIRHKHRASKVRKLVTAVALCTTSIGCSRPDTMKLRPKLVSDDWLSYDTTQVVVDAIRSNRSTINIQFLRRGRPMACYDLIRRNTPFLLVYSDAPVLIDKKRMQTALYTQEDNEDEEDNDDNNHRNHDQFDSDEEDNAEVYKRHRMKRSSGYYSYSESEDNANEADRLHMHVQQFRNMGPRMLQSRKKMRKSAYGRGKNRAHKIDPMMGFGTAVNDKEGVLEPSKAPESDHDDLTVVLLGGSQRTEQKCARRKLLVQFRDIGWEHWIIAPTSFEAHYCSGSCPFPLQKDVNPSNHAIVQSIIHTIGLNPYVPAVCCAPDKMDSLTLLYFDEMDNVVLKNYPKMIVSSCSCL